MFYRMFFLAKLHIQIKSLQKSNQCYVSYYVALRIYEYYFQYLKHFLMHY